MKVETATSTGTNDVVATDDVADGVSVVTSKTVPNDTEDDDYDEDDEIPQLPLFFYQRKKKRNREQSNTAESSSHPFVTSSIMGKVILNSTTSVWNPTTTTPVSNTTTAIVPTTSFDDRQQQLQQHHEEGNRGVDTANDTVSSTTMSTPPLPQHTWYNQTIYIVVCGYSNGQIAIYEASTNTPIIDRTSSSITTLLPSNSSSNSNTTTNTTSTSSSIDPANTSNPVISTSYDDDMDVLFNTSSWYVTTNTDKFAPIVDVSIDASGTIITGIDTNGNCSIWTVKYSIQYIQQKQQSSRPTAIPTNAATTTANQQQQSSPSTKTSSASSGNLLTKLFWRTTSTPSTGNTNQTTTSFTTGGTASASSGNETNQQQQVVVTVPILTMVDVKVNRLQPYSDLLYGIPTCICLDPQFIMNYKLMIGFTSGKVVVTTRNWMRRYEEHMILPYYTNSKPSSTTITTTSSVTSNLQDQTTIVSSTNDLQNSIETIVWRSNIVAFADRSGIKIYDIQSYKPIAHVDRPIGANPSLYVWMNDHLHNTSNEGDKSKNSPSGRVEAATIEQDGTISTGTTENEYKNVRGQIKPHLVFETSRSLLVAWGDCFMTLTINDATTALAPTSTTSTTSNNILPAENHPTGTNNITTTNQMTSSINNNKNLQQQTSVRKRNVACTMAWALDGIVASDIVPIDERHVAVLGYVLTDDDEISVVDRSEQKTSINVERNDSSVLTTSKQRVISNPYEMELQVLDRTNGSILYADLIQVEHTYNNRNPTATYCTNQNCRLLSTFALPRMDDLFEIKEETGDRTIDNLQSLRLIDPHLKWSLSRVSFPSSFPGLEEGDKESKYDDDVDSVDSDEYDFIIRATKKNAPSEALTAGTVSPPLLLIVSDIDTIVARVRDIDDAIQYALEQRRPATALNLALSYRTHQLRRFTLSELITVYLRALLRLRTPITATSPGWSPAKTKSKSIVTTTRKLSLRRMTIAAQSLPVLLGGNVEMWKIWLSELEKIPGAMFVVRKYIPVRDPKLPKSVYARVLKKMLEELEKMRQSSKPDMTDRLVIEAEGHFIHALIAWGTTQCLREHVKLLEYQTKLDMMNGVVLRRIVESLRHRYEQSAATYLDPSSIPVAERLSEDSVLFEATSSTVFRDSLYSTDEMFAELAQRISIIDFSMYVDNEANLLRTNEEKSLNSRVTIDSMARLLLMKNSYDLALRCFLVICTVYSSKSLEEMEDEAIKIVNEDVHENFDENSGYSFVLSLIENHHLHQYLLDPHFLPEGINCSPICALIRLVGLRLSGEFLIQNCTPPQQAISRNSSGERCGTLPLDLVSGQLIANPKLFHWYLHTVSMLKPELYVKFPTTANPSATIIGLHKKHLELYIRYAGLNRDSMQALAGVETYQVTHKSTPLLSFLKAVLQLGTIGPIEVGKLLEIERRGGAEVSRIFALELAYILENYGNKDEPDALLILDLFLKGTQSLMLAVSFAQRTKAHSNKLWTKLIEHCLLKSESEKSSDGSFSGILFGSLLEAAALSGADLSHLVAQIPKGMQVEGLRPRLISAVGDYRLKVQLHSMSTEISLAEKTMLVLESSRRSRRGMSYFNPQKKTIEEIAVADESSTQIERNVVPSETSQLMDSRPRSRFDRYSHFTSLPIR